MTPFARQFDNSSFDPDHRERDYRRGLEIRAEQTFDDDVDGDDLETHEGFETQKTGLIIRSKKELY